MATAIASWDSASVMVTGLAQHAVSCSVESWIVQNMVYAQQVKRFLFVYISISHSKCHYILSDVAWQKWKFWCTIFEEYLKNLPLLPLLHTAFEYITAGCLCQPGWYDADCSTPCPFGRYGLNCSATCKCHNGGICLAGDGSCICAPGYTGDTCEQSKYKFTTPESKL